ncbi:MAG: hypothetical protein ACJAS7_000413 [Alpinimonas sp.]
MGNISAEQCTAVVGAQNVVTHDDGKVGLLGHNLVAAGSEKLSQSLGGKALAIYAHAPVGNGINPIKSRAEFLEQRAQAFWSHFGIGSDSLQ